MLLQNSDVFALIKKHNFNEFANYNQVQGVNLF